jgi:hypothetical protein
VVGFICYGMSFLAASTPLPCRTRGGDSSRFGRNVAGPTRSLTLQGTPLLEAGVGRWPNLSASPPPNLRGLRTWLESAEDHPAIVLYLWGPGGRMRGGRRMDRRNAPHYVVWRTRRPRSLVSRKTPLARHRHYLQDFLLFRCAKRPARLYRVLRVGNRSSVRGFLSL